MFHTKKKKIPTFWIITILLVITSIAVLYFNKTSGLSETFNNTKKSIPSIKSQPQDTLVAKDILPIHNWKTKNGINVVFVPTENLPIIDIDISFCAGSAKDGTKHGLANLVVHNLEQGIKSTPNDATAIALAFEGYGSQLYTNVSKDRTQIKLRTLILEPKKLKSLLNTFHEVILEPTFPIDSFNNIKEQVLTSLTYDKQNPKNIIVKAFIKALYQEHPYAHPVKGYLDSVNSITIEDLKNFHKSFYVAKNTTITIVGGIHRNKAKQLAENFANKIPTGNRAETLPKVTQLASQVNQKIIHPVTQGQIMLGKPAVPVNHPDQYALKLGNHILGGGMLTSRLAKQIREDKGLAYTVYSSVQGLQQAGPFFASIETKTSTTTEALKLIKDILQDFIENGPTQTELAEAKNNMINSLPVNFDSNSSILAAASMLNFYNMPLNYLDTYAGNINNLTANDVQQAFKRQINSDYMAEVILNAE